MEWLLDNLQLVIAIVLLVAYGLRGIRGAGRGGDAEETSGDGEASPSTDFDPDEAERTRRIQEEIRRRILARQRGEGPTGPPVVVNEERPAPATLRPEREPPVVPREPDSMPRPVVPPPVPPRSVPAQPTFQAADEAVIERQRRLEERMRELQKTPKIQTPSFWADRPARSKPRAVAAAGSLSSRLRADLRNPQSLRRAILLREILGLPPGLEVGPPRLPRR